MNLYQQLKPNQNSQKIQIKKSKSKKTKQSQSKASNLNDKKESCQKVTTDNCTQTCNTSRDIQNVDLDCDTTKDCNNNNNTNQENIMNEILQQSETNNNCDNELCNSVSQQESNNPLNINNLEVDNN